MRIAFCPQCDKVNEVSNWGSILLPFDQLKDDDELVCPECHKPSKLGDLTLGFTGELNVVTQN